MAAIGSTITQAIPAVGNSGTQYATDVNAFLAEVKARLEARVPFSSLLTGAADLDLGNKALLNAQYLGLYDSTSAPAASPTSRLVSSNGELYYVKAAGAVQVTSGSGLNAAGIGGITGDYGGANPATLRFVDADLRYNFYDDYAGAAWAYIRALGLDVAAGATSAVRARVLFAGAGNLTFTLPPTVPAANRAPLAIDSTGAITANEAATPFTAGIDLGASSATAVIRHGNRVITQPLHVVESAAALTQDASGVSTTTITNYAFFSLSGLTAGSRLVAAYVTLNKATANITTIQVHELLGGSSAVLFSGTDNVAGSRTISAVAGTPATVYGYRTYLLRVSMDSVGDKVWSINLTFDQT